MDEDELIPVRSAYYLGDYKGVIKQARSLKSLRGLRAKERDSYVARVLIAQGKFDECQSTILRGDSLPTPLLSVKQYLVYKQSKSEEERELIVEQLKSYYLKDSDGSIVNNVCFVVNAAQLLINEQLYRDALKLLLSSARIDDNLELMLMTVQLYLVIRYVYMMCQVMLSFLFFFSEISILFFYFRRVDLAKKVLTRMQELDDDDPCTGIASISVLLMNTVDVGKKERSSASGGSSSSSSSSTSAGSLKEKSSEVIEKIDDLIAGFSNTSLLCNLKAVAFMQMHDFKNSWRQLQKAKEIAAKEGLSSAPSATLVNGIVTLQQLSKGESTLPKLAGELSKSAPQSSFLGRTREMGILFDKCASSFTKHVKTL